MANDVTDDIDNPEWTEEDFAKAIPFKDAHPAIYDTWKRGRGRPTVAQPKVQFALRMGADVVEAVKATGKGYNGRLERLIRDALAKGML